MEPAHILTRALLARLGVVAVLATGLLGAAPAYAGAPGTASVVGPRSLLVVNVCWGTGGGLPASPCPANAGNTVTQVTSARNQFAKFSTNQFTWTIQDGGAVTIAPPTVIGCGTTADQTALHGQLDSRVGAVLTGNGVAYASFDTVLFHFTVNTAACAGGFATFGANLDVVIAGSNSLHFRNIAHQLGHTILGPGDADAEDCPTAISIACSTVDRGDPESIMGTGAGNFTTPQLNQLGWLASSRVQSASCTDPAFACIGVLTISRLGRNSTTEPVEAVRFTALGNAPVWIEYRASGTAGQPGVFLHREDPADPTASMLIDTSPGSQSNDFYDASLQAGESYVDPTTDIRYEISAVTPDTVQVYLHQDRRWGYVWADQPTAASYTPSLFYQNNSRGETNTITRESAGNYTVRFTRLGGFGYGNGRLGMVQVTAYGSSTDMCNVARWDSSGPDVYAMVSCSGLNGAAADTRFTASYERPEPMNGRHAYVWGNQPTAVTYEPSRLYQFNSAGLNNQIIRRGTGFYQVNLPGLASTTDAKVRGTMNVTAYGGGAVRCAARSSFPVVDSTFNEIHVHVDCVNSAGVPVDSAFTMTYTQDGSTLGAADRPSAYLFASFDRFAGSVLTRSTHQFNSSGGVNSVARNGVGNYTATLPLLNGLGGKGGHVKVISMSGATGVPSAPDPCKVVGWFPSNATDLAVNVMCFNPSGNPLDASFALSYVA